MEKLLGRDRIVVVVALCILCALTWAYVLNGAGLGMSAWSMSRLALFPHHHVAAAPDMKVMLMPQAELHWNIANWALMIAMWWTMMIAMMTPSAAPTILLYARVQHHAAIHDASQSRLSPTGAFAVGYLITWLAFSVAAAVVHWLLARAGSVSATMMDSRSRWLSASVLILAGFYQLSPFKNACLSHCRSPASFLSRYWRPGLRGALRLGVTHGAYCVGCCWALMALLFVGGVMNLIWIAALTSIVLIEKLLARGRWLGRAFGVMMIAWGMATLYF